MCILLTVLTRINAFETRLCSCLQMRTYSNCLVLYYHGLLPIELLIPSQYFYRNGRMMYVMNL